MLPSRPQIQIRVVLNKYIWYITNLCRKRCRLLYHFLENIDPWALRLSWELTETYWSKKKRPNIHMALGLVYFLPLSAKRLLYRSLHDAKKNAGSIQIHCSKDTTCETSKIFTGLLMGKKTLIFPHSTHLASWESLKLNPPNWIPPKRIDFLKKVTSKYKTAPLLNNTSLLLSLKATCLPNP